MFFYLLYEECQTVVGAAMKTRLLISSFLTVAFFPLKNVFYVQYAGQQNPPKPLKDCKPFKELKIKKTSYNGRYKDR